jgi:hypothetical protein
MVVRIAGQRMFLWRAVDHEGEVLDMLVQRRRGREQDANEVRGRRGNQVRNGLCAGGRWIPTIGPSVTCELCSAAPACAGATAVHLRLFCSSSHCMEPGCHTVCAGCGWRRCSAASASRR